MKILSFFKSVLKSKADKRKERLAKLTIMVKDLSDDELKEWYSQADSMRLFGYDDGEEASIIEQELDKRGFEHMTDY